MIASALQNLTEYSTSQFIVGFSGGIDSTVLLHALVQAYGPDQIVALHVNHQLQTDSAAWAEHCAKMSDSLGVTFLCGNVTEKPAPGDSIEAFARNQRRHFFEKALQAGGILLTAQHQDDQAETVLLQLCRGAGIKGLSAMPFEKSLGAGCLIRPFLEVSRSDIETYASQHQLKWLEDPSNKDSRFSRNFMRHEVMPILKSHYPGVVKAITRTASHCQKASEQLEQIADEWLLQCEEEAGLNVKALAAFKAEQQIQILHRWLSKQGFRASQAQLQQLQQQAHAKPGAKVEWGNREVCVKRNGSFLHIT